MSAAAQRRCLKRLFLKWVFERIPRLFRKACNLPVPPRLLAASCPLTCFPKSAAPERSSGRHAATQPVTILVRASLPGRWSVGSVRISLVLNWRGAKALPREISTKNHRSHIAMSYEAAIAWRASRTRTPPPICTCAPFPKPRWSLDRGRRERSKKYTMGDFPQSFDSCFRDESQPVLQECITFSKAKFLNRREESRA